VKGRVSEAQIAEIRKRGVLIIKQTVPRPQAEKWAEEAVKYLNENDYNGNKAKLDDPKDFFSGKTPQIYGVYWSKPQTEARQHPNMQIARAFLNSLWSHKISDTEIAFDPTREATYADRLRVRTPGNVSGLVPHVDGGSIERWTNKAYQTLYKEVFAGEWEKYNPFNGVDRVSVEELPFPNVCTVFRSYQGWLAVSPQGKDDGTLQTIPIVQESTSYFLLRPFLYDALEDDPLCGALPGRQHQFTNKKWFEPLLEGLVSIPHVDAGDTVWWHPDIIHAVEREHKGSGNSSVFYIGAVPFCPKNASYLVKQRETFLSGQASPDFPQEDREVSYVNRAQVSHLSDLGKAQLGLGRWEVREGEEKATLNLIQKCNEILQL